jgi:hypothetical protein
MMPDPPATCIYGASFVPMWTSWPSCSSLPSRLGSTGEPSATLGYHRSTIKAKQEKNNAEQ